MISRKISAFMDSELNHKLESLVLNLLPARTHSSDLNMLYIAETDVVSDTGTPSQTIVKSEDTFFVSVVDEAGFINFENIKLLHVPGVLASDYTSISVYPSIENMKYFSTYYEGREVPSIGGFMDFAFSPFTKNTIEMLNGDLIDIYGRGRIKITAEQRGLKGYKSVPEVKEILTSNSFKILPLALYSKYSAELGNTLSLSMFSPTMRVETEEVDGQLELTSDQILSYMNTNGAYFGDVGSVIDQKNDFLVPTVNTTAGTDSKLYKQDKQVYVHPNGYIDASHLKDLITPDFSIHTNFTLRNLALRGTIIFEIGYAKGSATNFTREVSLWVNPDGYIMYNCAHLNESINTGTVLKLDIENTITFTVQNGKFDELDNDEYITFIHLNGKQIWPAAKMIYEYQKDYLWKALTAWKVYNEVCANMPAPPPVTGGLDARQICVKKLLHESGFETVEALYDIYQLYLDRPRASKADLDGYKLNYLSEEDGNIYDSRIEKVAFGQDAYLDTVDPAYASDIEFSDILVTKAMSKKQIEVAHLLNTITIPAIK